LQYYVARQGAMTTNVCVIFNASLAIITNDDVSVVLLVR
jgi:uncharacterized membrane protein